MLDPRTPAELRELGWKMQPRLASDLMLNYILILRQHLCEPLAPLLSLQDHHHPHTTSHLLSHFLHMTESHFLSQLS